MNIGLDVAGTEENRGKEKTPKGLPACFGGSWAYS